MILPHGYSLAGPTEINFKAGDKVSYAGSVYEVAHIKMFGNGPMVGIYDEPPSKHIDYLKPGSLKLA